MEVEAVYGLAPAESTTSSLPVALDHHDVVSTCEYLKAQPFVDADRILLFGVSHGGELHLKPASDIQDPSAALVSM